MKPGYLQEVRLLHVAFFPIALVVPAFVHAIKTTTFLVRCKSMDL